MNDEKSADLDVTLDEYSRYFAEKGIRNDCPMCGEHKWLVHLEKDGRSFTIFYLQRHQPNIVKSPIAFVVNVYCDACGFVASFNRKKIEEWREKGE